MSETLHIRAYRFAFWEMLAYEQPIELPPRTFETRCEGSHFSVTEKDRATNEIKAQTV